MLIPRDIFKLRSVTVEESSRYVIGGVRFSRRADGKPLAEATNGLSAVAATWDEPSQDDYPKIVGVSAARAEEFKSVVILADACAKAERLCPPSRQQLSTKPILSFVLLDETQLPGELLLGATDLERVEVLRQKPLEGRWPGLAELYPTDGLTVELDGLRLRRLLALLPKGKDEKGKDRALFRLTVAAGKDGSGVSLAQSSAVLLTTRKSEGGGFGLEGSVDLTLSAILMPICDKEELKKTLKLHPSAYEPGRKK